MDLNIAQQFNAAAFVLNNHLVNENGNPIEFTTHKFLIQPYMDNAPKQAIIKAGQVGWSTTAIIRAFHLANYMKANIIYTLPSKSIVKDFVIPKVDPLIDNNPVIQTMVGDVDSMGLKSIGDRFVYFRSSWDEASGIAISAHILINDELDRSNPKAIRTYRTRLDAAKIDRPELGWEWQFSNPSIPGFGVDERWQQSDQKYWFIKCPHCNYQQYLTFPENIDFDKEIFICQKCQRELSNDDRTNGHWVPKFFGRDISGYWISQLMVPWHSAKKIIADSKGDQSVFYNFTLGLPYQPKDQSVSRQNILSCLAPGANPRTDVAIGVDVGLTKHYVIGNKYGIFRIGTTDSWQEIEDLRNQYGAIMVIDAMPYPAPVKKLVDKYPGKVFMNYYVEDKKQLGIIRWGELDKRGVVESDRTKIIDALVADILNKDIFFNLLAEDLEEYIYHWAQMYRTIDESEKGIQKPVWKHPEGRPDHFAHATVYFKIAMEKTMQWGGVVTTPSSPKTIVPEAPVVINQKIPALNIKEIFKRPQHQGRDWKLR